MIDQLIDEMFTPCSTCQGCGLGINKKTYNYEEGTECSECDGAGEVMSYMGAKLIQVIRDERR